MCIGCLTRPLKYWNQGPLKCDDRVEVSLWEAYQLELAHGCVDAFEVSLHFHADEVAVFELGSWQCLPEPYIVLYNGFLGNLTQLHEHVPLF